MLSIPLTLTPLKYDAATELSETAAIQTTAIILLALLGVEMYWAFNGWHITRYLQCM